MALEAADDGEDAVDSGSLSCPACHVSFPIIAGVPRFADEPGSDGPTSETKADPTPYAKRPDYNYLRTHAMPIRFSLACRSKAIADAIRRLGYEDTKEILDVGSADGLLAKQLMEAIPGIKKATLLDLDADLLQFSPYESIQGDCCQMPLPDNSFQLITAAAIIEHLTDPISFLTECRRVLKPGGALLMTTPAPFFEWLATQTGYMKEAGHVARYSIMKLRHLCGQAGLHVALAEKFMVTPVHVPGHARLENVLRKCRLSFMMMN